MDAVEDVKARLSIEDVVSEYVPLKRAGRNWRGLSPFTNEKTPSFMVSPEKQIWHDFSSGKGGNMFSFVMEVEGLDFKGALELLARKAGIDIELYRASTRRGGPDKKRLHELLELSAKFYQVQFSNHKAALEYVLQTRGFSKRTALEWQIGYAPNTGSALRDFAKTKGFTDADISQAGLSARGYRGNIQDMFRGRIILPLHDSGGQVIGFTARKLDDDPNAPKYINTPQTSLYDKSRHIYGLHRAKEAIRKSQTAVLVEGNLDVIACHQSGLRNVVATAGTALTEPQLKELGRFTGDIRLCFDADKAGIVATERAIPIASKVKVSLSVITLPDGKDPDDLVRQDPDRLQQAIEKPMYALDWLMKRYQDELDLNSAVGKRHYSDILLPVVRSLTDPVEKDHYLNSIAKKIDIDKAALTQKYQKTAEPQPTRKRKVKIAPAQVDQQLLENQKTQDNFLSLMLMRQTLREFLDLVSKEMLFTDSGIELLEFLKSHLDFNTKQPINLPKLTDYVKIEALLYEELYQGLELNELHYEAARLQARLIEQYVKTQKLKLAEAMESADQAKTRKLLGQAKKWDELLGKVKGAQRG